MKHEIELEPFLTPNFARSKQKPRPRQEGFKESEPIPLADLSDETLSALCDAFRAEVFRKAGRAVGDSASGPKREGERRLQRRRTQGLTMKKKTQQRRSLRGLVSLRSYLEDNLFHIRRVAKQQNNIMGRRYWQNAEKKISRHVAAVKAAEKTIREQANDKLCQPTGGEGGA